MKSKKYNTRIAILILWFLTSGAFYSFGQLASWDQRPTLQAGIEGGLLFESQLLQNFSSNVLDSDSDILLETTTQSGIRFGGFLRWRYYNNQHIESGIYRISRRYKGIATDDISGDELAREEVTSIGYEIPLVWTVGIRTTNSTYLYAGFGGMASFLASNFGKFTGDIQLNGIADPRFVPGLVVVAGYEWDWGAAGGVYIGGQFQHSFNRMGRMGLRYREVLDTIATGSLELNGSYVSLVMRYMLPGS